MKTEGIANITIEMKNCVLELNEIMELLSSSAALDKVGLWSSYSVLKIVPRRLEISLAT